CATAGGLEKVAFIVLLSACGFHRTSVATGTFGRRQTGMAKSVLPKKSSWTARTTSAADGAGTAKQILSSLAARATPITLTCQAATAENTRPRIPHLPFMDSP